jgi:hypothetical protein
MKILILDDEPVAGLIVNMLQEYERSSGKKFEIVVAQSEADTMSNLDSASIAILDLTREDRRHLSVAAQERGIPSILFTNQLDGPSDRFDSPLMRVIEKPRLDLQKFNRAIRDFIVVDALSKELLRQGPPGLN